MSTCIIGRERGSPRLSPRQSSLASSRPPFSLHAAACQLHGSPHSSIACQIGKVALRLAVRTVASTVRRTMARRSTTHPHPQPSVAFANVLSSAEKLTAGATGQTPLQSGSCHSPPRLASLTYAWRIVCIAEEGASANGSDLRHLAQPLPFSVQTLTEACSAVTWVQRCMLLFSVQTLTEACSAVPRLRRFLHRASRLLCERNLLIFAVLRACLSPPPILAPKPSDSRWSVSLASDLLP